MKHEAVQITEIGKQAVALCSCGWTATVSLDLYGHVGDSIGEVGQQMQKHVASADADTSAQNPKGDDA